MAENPLSQITVYSKYARYIPELGRRENWNEIIDRTINMHCRKYPKLEKEITRVFNQLVRPKLVLPSMRSLQFAGKPIELFPNRSMNCCALPMDDFKAFREVMFLLMGGTGVGYSVQQSHIKKLPEVKKPIGRMRYVVQDSIIGWSEAVNTLVKAYFFGKRAPEFDFRDIRPRGTLLKTSGGRAPGPKALAESLEAIRAIFEQVSYGSKLNSLQIHDINCHIAAAVLSGGIRRSACICLFDFDDELMLNCKTGNWTEENSQRQYANNSAMALRYKLRKRDLLKYVDRIQKTGFGEPGYYLANDYGSLTNPCQPGWATLLSATGQIIRMDDLDIGDSIWDGSKWVKVLQKWSTGIKPVYEYYTRAGVFIGTDNHKILERGEKIQVGNARAIDTAIGPSATSFLYCTKDDPFYLQSVMDGLVLGDGTVHKASNNLVGLCIGENDQDYFTSEIKHLIIKERPGVQRYFYEIRTSVVHQELPKTYERDIPDRFFYGNEKIKCAFLRGLYSANGSVISGTRVSLKSSSFLVIRKVQEMLSSLGIRSYYTTNKSKANTFKNGTYVLKQSYDLNITSDVPRFNTIIGFIQKYKQESLDELCIKRRGIRNTPSKTTYEIVDVVYLGEHEVFDITVDSPEHVYWTGGLCVSNCSEASVSLNFCNLTTFDMSKVESNDDLYEFAKAAAFIGTLQAGYTDYVYLRPIWQEKTEEEALLGVSCTGLARRDLTDFNFSGAAEVVKQTNELVAKQIGINKAYRTTTCKPEGTSSAVLETSSGVHAWHAKYGIRRTRYMYDEPIIRYLERKMPDLVEADSYDGLRKVLSLPFCAPENGLVREEESAIDLLERVKFMSVNWVKPGHRKGHNGHSVSATISVKENEWDNVGEWMWKNRNDYNGLSILPYNGGKYTQPPFEEIDEEKYKEMLLKIPQDINLDEVIEQQDNTKRQGELSCAGGACELDKGLVEIITSPLTKRAINIEGKLRNSS
jgi:hypothetical protein